MTEDDFEPARRELCSDDSCVGLVGPDGRCKVCGTVSVSAVADPRHRGLRLDARPDDPAELDDDRELCPDGACVGVIGADGRCGVCGTTGSGAPRGATGGIPRQVTPPVEPAMTTDDDPDEDRELCPDGACVGLIGPDRRCKVCRAPAPGP